MKQSLKRLFATAAVMAALCMPAVAADDSVSDPLEPVNRYIFAFNDGMDVVFIEPLAKLYRWVLPDYVLDRIQGVFVNIREPLSTMNYLFQGNLSDAGDSFLGFLVNSTVGLAGMYDVMGGQNEDKLTGFGDTLGRWGIGPGPYLVLPLIGPSDLRDTAGLTVDYYADPIRLALVTYKPIRHPETIYTTITVASGFDARSRLLKQIDDLRKNSLDLYATIRSIYLQRRAAKIGGDTSAPQIPAYDN